MEQNAPPENRRSSTRHRAETRRPDTDEGIEAARSKWEARLFADGLSRSGVRRLATAEEIRRRVKESRVRRLLALRREQEEAEAAWRRDFTPHAVIVTEREWPSNLFWMMFTGDERFVFFETGTNPADFRDYVLGVLPEETALFGKTVGYIVNYTPDWAVTFDRFGQRVPSHTEAYCPARASFRFSDGWFDARQGAVGGPYGGERGNLLQMRPAPSPRQLQDDYRDERRKRCVISGSATKATS